MNAKTAFDTAITRPEHLLRLYNLLHDTRQRSVRSDWAKSFRQVMRWPAGERFVRVDGLNKDSLLIMRQCVGVSREHFRHEFLSELLRAALAAAVSAMDRYCHDAVVQRSWRLLNRPPDQIPKELLKIQLSIASTKDALEKLRKDPKSRPGNLVKTAIRDYLHRRKTFQSADEIKDMAAMLGIEDVWTKVAKEMPRRTKDQILSTLRDLVKRRNQIVHEADLILKTRSSKVTVRDISLDQCRAWIEFVKEFVGALDRIFVEADR